jgi:putative ABC transport system permease protein
VRLLAGLKLAGRSISRHRLRAFFMTLGVLIGITSLTILYSVGERTKQETMTRFKNMMGTFDTVMVRPGGGRMRGMPTLTNVEPTLKFEDAEAVGELPGVKQIARLQSAFDIDVKYRNRAATPAVFGASANWLELRGDEVADGEFITGDDLRTLARVAVIGPDPVQILFPGENPIGKTIRIADVPFQIKGVLKSRGAGPGGASLDNLVMIPVTTASKRLFNRDYLTMAIVQLRDPLQADTAVEQISRLLRERHHLAPGALDDFTLTNPRAVMAQVTQVGSTLARLLSGVAVIAMLIGGVVIMSLMLIAVSERRKEIGVRRSVGASRRDILLQFLLEAVSVSGLGGILGMALGVGGTGLVARLEALPPVFAWNIVGWSCALSVAIGLVFGIYPAWKAATVDPIEALRS